MCSFLSSAFMLELKTISQSDKSIILMVFQCTAMVKRVSFISIQHFICSHKFKFIWSRCIKAQLITLHFQIFIQQSKINQLLLYSLWTKIFHLRKKKQFNKLTVVNNVDINMEKKLCLRQMHIFELYLKKNIFKSKVSAFLNFNLT